MAEKLIVTCKNCKTILSYERLENNEIFLLPCRKCLDAAFSRGEKAGYDGGYSDGYDAGYPDGAADNYIPEDLEEAPE